MAKKKAVSQGPETPVVDKSKQDFSIVRANINRVVEPSANYASIYANDAQVQLTPWDVRLIFGVISNIPSDDDPAVVVKQIGEVRVSLPMAKKMAMILIAQLAHYEKNVGPITLPEG